VEIEHFALASLVPFTENPRKATDDARANLKASVEAFGLFKPLLYWQGDDHPNGEQGPIVIGGNQRLHVLRAMEEAGELPVEVQLAHGMVILNSREVPTVRFPGSWAQAKIVAIRDNTQEGEWDWDSLPDYVAALEQVAGDVDFSLTGFDKQMLADLEALGSDPLLDVQDVASSEPEEESLEQNAEGSDDSRGTSFLTRKGARVVIGNIRGKIPVATYERWAILVKRYSGSLDTTELPAIMDAMAQDLEDRG